MPVRLLLVACITAVLITLARSPHTPPAPSTPAPLTSSTTSTASSTQVEHDEPPTASPITTRASQPTPRLATPDGGETDWPCLDVQVRAGGSDEAVRGQAIDVECMPRDTETEQRIAEDYAGEASGGVYWVAVPPARALRVRARDPVSGRTTAWRTIAPLPASALQVEVRLRYEGPIRPVHGRVVAASDGTPIAGARVHTTYDVLADAGANPRDRLIVTDATGAFVIDRAVAHEDVRVEARGFATVDGVFPDFDDPDRPSEIMLRRAAKLAGTVVDATERPIPWAVVTAARASGSTTRAARIGSSTQHRTVCDAAGRFELPAVPAESSLAVRAWALPIWAQHEMATLPDAAARVIHLESLSLGWISRTGFLQPLRLGYDETRDVRIRVEEPITITGRVVDALGAPVDSAEVRLLTAVNQRSGPTRPDGSFAFADVPRGDCTLQVFRHTGCTRVTTCSAPVSIRLERPGDGRDVQLVTGQCTIQGVVRTDPGTHEIRCWVTAQRAPDDWLCQHVRVATDGTFSLPSLAPGRYWLRVSGTVSSEALGPFPADGAPVELHASRYRAIRGHLPSLLSDDDEVVAVDRATGRWDYGQVDDGDDYDWDFEVDDLRPGTYDVIAYLRGDRIALAPSVVVGTDRDTVIERPLRPEPACVLRVRIDGPKADYRIAIHAQRWNVRLPEVWISAADVALGAYTDVIVPAGSLDVRVLVPNAGGPLASRHVHAVPGRESTLTIRLR